NILPHGLDPSLYLPMGNLTNAYKRSEMVDPDLGLAVYSLESLVSDRPEPAQALRATAVWSTGADGAAVSLDPGAIRDFRAGEGVAGGSKTTGVPGAYLLHTAVDLRPGESRTWFIVADVGIDQPGISELRHRLRSLVDPSTELVTSVAATARGLVEVMARADALQCTEDEIATAHHLANVTYNVMRGGIPLDGYTVDTEEFSRYLAVRNRAVAARHGAFISTMDAAMDRSAFIRRVAHTDDASLMRLAHEYLPFSFSRRHGDPSRPWNAFSIRVTDPEGNAVRYYEGNWRDIFQNWEAMCLSHPGYLPDIVSVFVNASTPDGFNPYRITSNGIDWEVPDPHDPWSNIGYWGDHQIVYLHRLLEASDRHLPGAITRLLDDARFAYADVPYRMVAYDRLVADPKSTIEYDDVTGAAVAARVADVGGDGRLVWSGGSIRHVTLAEKLVVPALAKLSNFVPGGGIWMNTQRPEWNDANNALVGHGLSMVTLYQLRAYLDYLRRLVADSGVHGVPMSREVADWLRAVVAVLEAAPTRPDGDLTDDQRMQMVASLGRSFSEYRERVYRDGFTGTTPVTMDEVIALCEAAAAHLDATIAGNRRPDGLFHAYNLIHFASGGEGATVEHLEVMLEGQVAAIESGVLDAAACADIVDALFASDLYRADQDSFMLYPARALPAFLDRNIVPMDDVQGNPLLLRLLTNGGGGIVVRDLDGHVRFDAELPTRDALGARLEVLAGDPAYSDLVREHGSSTVAVYGRVFGHHAYTGRSGSMYAYEGIGSIYWHMVAKLLVAIQGVAIRRSAAGDHPDSVQRLIDGYWRVRAGLGYNKQPADHGAIPLDPYSHTPRHAGAQQPGMTGLVKEEILVRPAELGVIIDRGEIHFDAMFLRTSELLTHECEWSTFDPSCTWDTTEIPAGSLAMTLCQVPIIITKAEGAPWIEIDLVEGDTVRVPGASLGQEWSSKVFDRSGQIRRIRAFVDA
ncbi:MAG: hypothetical protein R6W79_11390, partial [Acidimicrobiia bacterium]